LKAPEVKAVKVNGRTLPNPLAFPPTIVDPHRRRHMPLAALRTGLKTSLQVFFRKPVTYQYPENKLPVSERYRGRIGLELDLCIGCTLCAQACPNGTCFMVDHKYEKTEEMAKKFPNRRDIMPAVEIARCIYCSLCEEVCPTGAIHMTPEYELARERRDMVYTPDLLQMTEAEIDAMDPGIVKDRMQKGRMLILQNDKKRI
jgi:NADH-quinone oxidoreductase chain I